MGLTIKRMSPELADAAKEGYDKAGFVCVSKNNGTAGHETMLHEGVRRSTTLIMQKEVSAS